MPKQITVYSAKEFRAWLKKYHKKETKMSVIVHKRHTGKPAPTHRAQCFNSLETLGSLQYERYGEEISRPVGRT